MAFVKKSVHIVVLKNSLFIYVGEKNRFLQPADISKSARKAKERQRPSLRSVERLKAQLKHRRFSPTSVEQELM